jgi:DNA-binding transcriptional regulator YiaG
MTGSQLRRIHTRLKLTQVELAEEIGVHANSVARWERDEVGISEPVARLVRVLARQIPRQQEG